MNDQPYRLAYAKQAQDDLKKLDKQTAARIVKKLKQVADRGANYSHFALSGNWAGFYRVRIGSYRAIYRLDHNLQLMIVIEIGHRREIYD